MKSFTTWVCLACAGAFLASGRPAMSDPFVEDDIGEEEVYVTPGYDVDHHDHVVRDSHGHVIGKYHHDVIHKDSTYILPHSEHADHHGTYYSQGGNYYYHGQTASSDPDVYGSIRPARGQ